MLYEIMQIEGEKRTFRISTYNVVSKGLYKFLEYFIKFSASSIQHTQVFKMLNANFRHFNEVSRSIHEGSRCLYVIVIGFQSSSPNPNSWCEIILFACFFFHFTIFLFPYSYMKKFNSATFISFLTFGFRFLKFYKTFWCS